MSASESPDAQMPIVYHFVGDPSARTACIETRMKVPVGVSAIQDETSSLNPNPVAYAGDVHVPTS